MPNPAALLADEGARKRLLDAVTSRGMEISALSCHGNPLHPKREIAEAHDRDFREAIQLAQQLEVPNVITFSGCPGGGPDVARAELGDLPLAAGLSGDPRVAMERAGHSVLD